MRKAMSLKQAHNQRLVNYPQTDGTTWIVWDYTHNRMTYIGNKAGAEYQVDGDSNKYYRSIR
jgi:hypothetical protein